MRFLLRFKPTPIHTKRKLEHGFTLVEVLVIAPIIVLMIGGMIAGIIAITGDILVSQARNKIVFTQQDTVERILNDVELSTNFLPSSDITIVSPQGYNNVTDAFLNANTTASNKGDMLILKTILTDKNPLATDRQLVRINTPSPCTSANPLMYGVVVYFVKDSSLWRRTILPSDYATTNCTAPWQQPSCYPGISGAICRTTDVELISGVGPTTFTVKYFAKASSTTHNTTASNSAATITQRRDALNLTDTVEIGLTVTQKAAGKDLTQATTFRATKRNQPVQ